MGREGYLLTGPWWHVELGISATAGAECGPGQGGGGGLRRLWRPPHHFLADLVRSPGPSEPCSARWDEREKNGKMVMQIKEKSLEGSGSRA